MIVVIYTTVGRFQVEVSAIDEPEAVLMVRQDIERGRVLCCADGPEVLGVFNPDHIVSIQCAVESEQVTQMMPTIGDKRDAG